MQPVGGQLQSAYLRRLSLCPCVSPHSFTPVLWGYSLHTGFAFKGMRTKARTEERMFLTSPGKVRGENKHLPRSGYCPRWFAFINIDKPPHNPVRQVVPSSLCREERHRDVPCFIWSHSCDASPEPEMGPLLSATKAQSRCQRRRG